MDRQRDPAKVGYEWCAWYALQGDEPLECVAEAARDLDRRLGLAGAGQLDEAETRKAITSARLFTIAIAELLDPDGTSAFKATIGRRRRGKPHNKLQSALDGHRAASIVRRLLGEEWKVEAAVAQAMAETGLSRAEVFAWHSHDQTWLAPAPAPIVNERIDKTE